MNQLRFEELLLAWEDQQLTDEELAEFKQILSEDQSARQRLVEIGMIETKAIAKGKFWMEQPFFTGTDFLKSGKSRIQRVRWWQWRPLAAAAGVAVGCLSTSVLWAISTPHLAPAIRRTSLPLTNPGFERQEALPHCHLLPKTGQWTGFETEIVTAGGQRPKAKAGGRMLRLGAAPAGKGYFANLMTDLDETKPSTSSPLQIELAAYFHASVPGHGEHYVLRAATFGKDATHVSEVWERTWSDIELSALTHSGKAIFPTPEQGGWQPITIRIDVPPQARTLVISMGSNTPGPVEERTNHFIDEVSATWLIHEKSQSLP